jgi:heat shock protein HslJ
MFKLRIAATLALAGTLCLAAGAATTLAQGSTAGGSPGTGIEGTDWILKQQAAGGSLADVAPGVIVTLRMALGQASGSGGCNSYHGSYTLDGSSLSFGPLAATQMACADPAGGTEHAYFGNLAQVASYTFDGTNLSLADAGGKALLSYASAPPSSIDGGWVVTGYNNGKGAVTTPITTTLLTMVFGPDGTIAGSSGCNHYSGSYTVDGNKLTVGPVATTQMACTVPQINDQEMQFLAALAASDTWSQDGNVLTLSSESQLSGATTITAVGAVREDYVGEWLMLGLNTGQTVMPPMAGQMLTLVLRPDGSAEGYAGCNSFFGPYVVSGSSMTIGPLAATYATCVSQAVMTQEQQYLTALQSTAAWTIDESGELTLSDASGVPQVKFSRPRAQGK